MIMGDTGLEAVVKKEIRIDRGAFDCENRFYSVARLLNERLGRSADSIMTSAAYLM
jgi:hypothetical protein